MGSGCINRQKVKSQRKSTVNAVDQSCARRRDQRRLRHCAGELRHCAGTWWKNRFYAFWTKNHFSSPKITYLNPIILINSYQACLWIKSLIWTLKITYHNSNLRIYTHFNKKLIYHIINQNQSSSNQLYHGFHTTIINRSIYTWIIIKLQL